MKVLHIITDLEAGGAERVLIRLLAELKQHGVNQAVIIMKPGGELSKEVTALEIPLFEIPFSFKHFPKSIQQCNQIISNFQPTVIQSWMYHADFITNFLKKKRQIKIIWGVHHSFEKPQDNKLKLLTKVIVQLNAFLSRITPKQIICCSKSAMETHAKIGYIRSKLTYIPNGVNMEEFKPDLSCRKKLHDAFGLPTKTYLIGYIARYHPQKDHETFFQAASLLLQKQSNVHFILVGKGITDQNESLKNIIQKIGHKSHFHLLGYRKDVPTITAGLDIATLTSSGDEAFPLTMIEAMACEVPCVATNVGDVRETLSQAGLIVKRRDPQELANAWAEILVMPLHKRVAMGKFARKRILEHFTHKAMARNYLTVYQSVTINNASK